MCSTSSQIQRFRCSKCSTLRDLGAQKRTTFIPSFNKGSRGWKVFPSQGILWTNFQKHGNMQNAQNVLLVTFLWFRNLLNMLRIGHAVGFWLSSRCDPVFVNTWACSDYSDINGQDYFDRTRYDLILSFCLLFWRNLHEISFIWEYNSVFPRSPNWHKSSKDHLQLISFPQAPFPPYIIQILMILYQSKSCYTHYSILIGVMVGKPCQAHVYYTPCFWRMPRPTQHALVWLRPVCP